MNPLQQTVQVQDALQKHERQCKAVVSSAVLSPQSFGSRCSDSWLIWNGFPLQPNEIANCKTRRSGEASDTAKETNNTRFACGDERKNDYFTKVAKVVVARVQENGRKKLKPAKKCRVSSLSHLAFHIPPLPGRTDARFVRDGLSG